MGSLLKDLADCGDFSEECLQRAYTKAGYKKDFESIKKKVLHSKESKKYEEYFKVLQAVKKRKILLDSSTASYAKFLADKATNHKGVRKVLMFDNIDFDGDSLNEYKILFKYRGFDFIAILDNLLIDWKNKVVKINDVKTTSKNVANFQQSFEYYKYYLQLAVYKQAVEQLIIDSGYNPNEFSFFFNIICIQTQGLPQVRVFHIKDEWLDKGERELIESTDRIRWHYDNNSWEYPKEYYESGGVELL